MKKIALVTFFISLFASCANSSFSFYKTTDEQQNEAYQLHRRALAAYHDEQDLVAAERYWAKAIVLNPVYQDALFNRSVMLLLLGQPTEALDVVNFLLQLNPTYAQAYNQKGLIYQALGNYSEAVKQFQQAYRLNKGYTVAIFNLGNAYYRIGLRREAVRFYSMAISQNASDASYYYNRALAYEKLGRRAKAKADYWMAVTIDTTLQDAAFEELLGL